MAISIYQLKSNVINSEFRGFIRGLNNSEAIIPELKSSDDFLHAEKMINLLLLSHPKIKHGWYAIASGKDTVYVTLDKNDTGYKRGTILGYQKKWIDSQLIAKDSLTRIGTIVSVKDSLHGLLASRHRLADSSILILGLDINFEDLQRYLWSVEIVKAGLLSILLMTKDIILQIQMKN
ncbi:hypothetical protein [Pedobacter sp. NJ-S-72]